MVAGHNVYSFDNIILMESLESAPRFDRYFIPTTDIEGAGYAQHGFILNIPGVINLDIYIYIYEEFHISYVHITVSRWYM